MSEIELLLSSLVFDIIVVDVAARGRAAVMAKAGCDRLLRILPPIFRLNIPAGNCFKINVRFDEEVFSAIYL